jgi:O-antigen ligase
MKRSRLKTSPLPIMLAGLLTAIVFTLDLYAPATIATVLYVAPVALIAMWSPPGHASLVVIIAAMCTALTVSKLAYFSLEPIAWATVSNHVLAVCALWTIVLVSLVRKRREQRAHWIDVLPRL